LETIVPLTLHPSTPRLAEGGALAFTVTATPGDEGLLLGPLSWVVLDAHGNVAVHGDFERASGDVPAGIPGQPWRAFTVSAFADRHFEGAEGYTVQIRSGAAAGDPLGGALEAEAGLALEDGDAPPAYVICDAAPVAEGGELVFAVFADVSVAGGQTVWYSVDGGDPQALVIPAGATSAEIRVSTRDDDGRADHPAVAVELLGASVGTASGAATGFVDDDEHVSFYAVSGGGSAVEGGELAFTVTRTGRLDAETVHFSLGGTASAGIDHALRHGSVRFEAGETAKTVLVRTFLDAACEPGERAVLTLESASAGGVFEGASATGTVADLALTGTLRRQVEVEAGPDGNVYPGTEALWFADGWLAFDGGTDLGSAFRLYQAALGRAPDAIGLGFWTAALDTGRASLSEVAHGFVASPEFQERFGVPEHGGFVDLLYRHVLGREADAEGSAFWTGKLEAGALARADVLVCFSESAELKEGTASHFACGVWAPDPAAVDAMRFYGAVFDRLPDAEGLSFWIGARQDGVELARMAEAFTGSAESGVRYGALSDEGFVEQLYLNALDRAGDAEGVAHWVERLDSGELSRAEVVEGFAFSLEMTRKLTPYAEDGCAFV
jgi:hypothetical protein